MTYDLKQMQGQKITVTKTTYCVSCVRHIQNIELHKLQIWCTISHNRGEKSQKRSSGLFVHFDLQLKI